MFPLPDTDATMHEMIGSEASELLSIAITTGAEAKFLPKSNVALSDAAPKPPALKVDPLSRLNATTSFDDMLAARLDTSLS